MEEKAGVAQLIRSRAGLTTHSLDSKAGFVYSPLRINLIMSRHEGKVPTFAYNTGTSQRCLLTSEAFVSLTLGPFCFSKLVTMNKTHSFKTVLFFIWASITPFCWVSKTF